MWKEEDVSYFKVLSQDLPTRAEKKHKKPSQDSRNPNRDFKLKSPEHKKNC
jgi:hypothetical protein